ENNVLVLLRDGAAAAGLETVAYNSSAKTLTLTIKDGQSTAANIVAAIEAAYFADPNGVPFHAAFFGTTSTGLGLVRYADLPGAMKLQHGDTLARAKLIINPDGANNGFVIEANDPGASLNGLLVYFNQGAAAAVAYDPLKLTLAITINEGISTVNDILNAFTAAGPALPVHAQLYETNRTANYELYPSLGAKGNTILNLSGKSNGYISLATLTPGVTYLLKVNSPNLVPTIYNLAFELEAGQAAQTINLAATVNSVRKDVILGGAGHDRLMGGMGEDWIFGGPGNDVLSGGLDRQASDLLFGGPGDDSFQIIPDYLPLLKDSDQTFIPTTVDQLFGGDGNDRVLFLGGDLDNLSRPIPDFASIRYNRILHRYEFTTLI
ncbi:MAG: hypothetical protein Q7U75_18830, partial [Desulfobacterales bacterium]|nr:hypothetical protein [Desulfobacterales bacterium]